LRDASLEVIAWVNCHLFFAAWNEYSATL
jgi:hypothetical protein